MKARKTFLTALGVAALAVTPAALAKTGPDNHGATDDHADHGNHGAANNGGGNGKGKDPTVTYMFKGTYSGDGSVAVAHGNRHVRRAELVDTTVAFDLSAARLTVADTNADGVKDISDVAAGDKVLVTARLPKSSPGTAPYAAKRLVDQTHPPAEEPAPAP